MPRYWTMLGCLAKLRRRHSSSNFLRYKSASTSCALNRVACMILAAQGRPSHSALQTAPYDPEPRDWSLRSTILRSSSFSISFALPTRIPVRAPYPEFPSPLNKSLVWPLLQRLTALPLFSLIQWPAAVYVSQYKCTQCY